MFARLAFALHDEILKKLIERVAPPEAILDRVRVLEKRDAPGAAKPDGGDRAAATPTE
jgi:hypothetical protein